MALLDLKFLQRPTLCMYKWLPKNEGPPKLLARDLINLLFFLAFNLELKTEVK